MRKPGVVGPFAAFERNPLEQMRNAFADLGRGSVRPHWFDELGREDTAAVPYSTPPDSSRSMPRIDPRAVSREEAAEIEARREAEASAVVVIQEPPNLFDEGMLTAEEAKRAFQVLAGRARGKQATMRAWAWRLCIIAHAIDEAAASPWLTDEQLASICSPLCQDCEAEDGFVISAPDPDKSDTVARFIGSMRQHNGGPIPDRTPVNCGSTG